MRAPLIMARGKSLIGPFFGKINGGKLMHTAGNFLSTSPAPVWIAIPDVNVSQGLPWTIDLNDYVTGIPVITFSIATGALPVGITLNANGTFSGTVTDLSGSGSVTFNATNSAGTAESGTLSWTIP